MKDKTLMNNCKIVYVYDLPKMILTLESEWLVFLLLPRIVHIPGRPEFLLNKLLFSHP